MNLRIATVFEVRRHEFGLMNPGRKRRGKVSWESCLNRVPAVSVLQKISRFYKTPHRYHPRKEKNTAHG